MSPDRAQSWERRNPPGQKRHNKVPFDHYQVSLSFTSVSPCEAFSAGNLCLDTLLSYAMSGSPVEKGLSSARVPTHMRKHQTKPTGCCPHGQPASQPSHLRPLSCWFSLFNFNTLLPRALPPAQVCPSPPDKLCPVTVFEGRHH